MNGVADTPGWYPLALASDLQPATSFGTRLFGREIVVWRDAEGLSHVWEDRCPHRGMRLSFGFVRGTHIACLYHGWQFDGGGRCRYIPAHPQLEVPATIAVSRHVSVERRGMVWVRVGEEAAAGPAPQEGATATPVRSLAVEAPAAVVAAALAAAAPLPESRLRAAVQPVSVAQATLHLLLEGAASGEERHQASLWAEAFRRAVESAAEAAA